MVRWSKDWIQTKGSNKIVAEYEQTDGKITSYQIKQTPCKYADQIYRSQSFNIGLYSKQGKLIESIENVTLGHEEVT